MCSNEKARQADSFGHALAGLDGLQALAQCEHLWKDLRPLLEHCVGPHPVFGRADVPLERLPALAPERVVPDSQTQLVAENRVCLSEKLFGVAEIEEEALDIPLLEQVLIPPQLDSPGEPGEARVPKLVPHVDALQADCQMTLAPVVTRTKLFYRNETFLLPHMEAANGHREGLEAFRQKSHGTMAMELHPEVASALQVVETLHAEGTDWNSSDRDRALLRHWLTSPTFLGWMKSG